jgi:hypothetical protein
MRLTALLWLAACGGNPARERIDAAAPVAPAPADYTCPMHPAVHADHPGACPVCGMPLVEAKK